MKQFEISGCIEFSGMLQPRDKAGMKTITCADGVDNSQAIGCRHFDLAGARQ